MEKRSTEYFVCNSSFRNWVKTNDPQLGNYWRRWIKAHPEDIPSIEEARFLIKSINFNESELEDKERSQLFSKVQHSLELANSKTGNAKKNVTPVFRIGLLLKFAAAISLLIGTYLFYQQWLKSTNEQSIMELSEIVKETPLGAKLTFGLPDGTLVKLNSGSKISFPPHFEGSERRVALTGEAYFEVAKDSLMPFIVDAGAVSVKALGTEFSLLNEPAVDSICVSLTEGKVLVETNYLSREQQLIIDGGQTASFSHHRQELKGFNFLDERLIDWVDNTIVFKQANWNEIQTTLERWYGVEVETRREMKHWKYTARFKNYSLENILKSICFTNKLNYDLNEKKVIIY